MGIEYPTELFAAARTEVNKFARARSNDSSGAERALSELLDALVLELEITGDYTDELPDEFVRLIMIMLRCTNYKDSLEGYLMHIIASNRVNPGFVFRAQWPGCEVNIDRTPVVLVQRFKDPRS